MDTPLQIITKDIGAALRTAQECADDNASWRSVRSHLDRVAVLIDSAYGMLSEFDDLSDHYVDDYVMELSDFEVEASLVA